MNMGVKNIISVVMVAEEFFIKKPKKYKNKH